MKRRRRFTPEFKAQIVLEVLTGVQSSAEACRGPALSSNLLAAWKAAFLEQAPTIFQGDERRDEDQARSAELEPRLGRATRPIEILKNASTPRDPAATRTRR
jgi:transposase